MVRSDTQSSNLKAQSSRSGYTFFELITVIGVTIIFGSVALLNLPTGLRSKLEIENAIGNLKAHLILVQQRAISQENGAKWGIHIDTSVSGRHFYQVFYGDSYETGIIVETVYLPDGMVFLSPSNGNTEDIIFDKVTGKTPSGHSIIIGLENVSEGSHDDTTSGNLTVAPETGVTEQLPAIPSFDAAVSLSPISAVVLPGESAVTTVSANILSGIPESADFSATNLPADTTASFSPVSCLPTCSSELTLQTGAGVPAGTHLITVSITAGTVVRSATFSLEVVTQSPPGAPENLLASGENGQISLTWQTPTFTGGSPVTNYKVYRSTTSGNETYLADAGAGTSYVDTGLTNGTTYYYKVSAVNINGEGALSTESSGTPTANVPSSPLNLTAIPGDSRTDLSWSVPSDDGGATITGYKIYRGTTSGGETLSATIGNVLTYADLSLANGTTYYYKVAAVNSSGPGNQSSEVSSLVGAVASAPNNLSATLRSALSILTVDLSWGAPSDNGGFAVTGYKIYRGSISGSEALLATVGDVLTYADSSDVARSSTQYYKITAINSKGESSYSNEDFITRPARVFITSSIYDGNLGNADGADAKCQTSADDAVLGGSWKAWINSSNYTSVPSRFVQYNSGYKKLDGTSIANNWADLTDGNLSSPINMDESGTYVPNVQDGANGGEPLTWTNANYDGSIVNGTQYAYSCSNGVCQFVSPYDCNHWTSSSQSFNPGGTTYNLVGIGGNANLSNSEWAYSTNSTSGSYFCNASRRLYCFEQPTVGPIAPTVSAGAGEALSSSSERIHGLWTANGADTTSYFRYSDINPGSCNDSFGVRAPSQSGGFIPSYSSNIDYYQDITNLVSNKVYYFCAIGSNSDGIGLSSVAFFETLLGSPQNLSSSAVGRTVTLNWSAPVNNGGSSPTSYKIYRSTSSGTETLLTTLGNVLNYTDTVSAPGTYYYKVSAANSVGEGNLSSEVSVVAPPDVPSQPMSLLTTASNFQVNLSWQAPSDNGGSSITNYKIYRGTSSGGESLVATVGNVLTYADSVNNGYTYYYKITAVNSVGEGLYSNESSVILSSSTSEIPLNLSAHSDAIGGMTLTWNAPTYDGGASITNYKIYRGTSSGGESLVATVGNVLTYTDTGLLTANRYYYKISTVNSIGESQQTSEVNAQTSVRAFVTSSVYNGNLGGASGANTKCQTAASSAGVSGNWLAWLDTPASSYRVDGSYIRMDGIKIANSWTDLTDGSLLSSLNVNQSGGLTNGYAWTNVSSNGSAYQTSGTYYCNGWATNSSFSSALTGYSQNTNGAWTQAVGSSCNNNRSLYCFEVAPSGPGAPAALTSTDGNQQITLFWSAPLSDGGTPITNYKIYRGPANGVSGSEQYLTTVGNILTYTDTGLTNGAIYYYQVSAVNGVGEGSRSVEINPSPNDIRRVFVTAGTYNGNLGGLSGADAKCQTAADTASLGGTWKAWLSDGTASAASRLTHGEGPYRRINHPGIGGKWTDLTDGTIGAINIEHNGPPVVSGFNVWTGTNYMGSVIDAANRTCVNWTSSAGGWIAKYGYYGQSNQTGTGWTQTNYFSCNNGARLYCFEQ